MSFNGQDLGLRTQRWQFDSVYRYHDCVMAYKNVEDRRQASRAHYLANSDVYKLRASKRRRAYLDELKQFVRKAKDVPCADCGVKYPYYVMQFDHVDPNKNFDIASVRRRLLSIAVVAAEIARCEVVCANCHAERTHRRGQRFSRKPERRQGSLF